MPQFRFYITDLHRGAIVGTNNEAIARNCAESEDFFVADTEKGVWLVSGDDEENVLPIAEEETESPSPCDPSQDGG